MPRTDATGDPADWNTRVKTGAGWPHTHTDRAQRDGASEGCRRNRPRAADIAGSARGERGERVRIPEAEVNNSRRPSP